MDRGVNTNLHPLFVSAERRRKKHRNLIVFGAAGSARARLGAGGSHQLFAGAAG